MEAPEPKSKRSKRTEDLHQLLIDIRAEHAAETSHLQKDEERFRQELVEQVRQGVEDGMKSAIRTIADVLKK